MKQRAVLTRLIVTLAACFTCTGASAMDAPKTLTFEADDWCPINCDPSTRPAGVGVDLIKKIYEPLGYRVNYVMVPWQQALQDVRSGKADGVIGANHSDDPRLIFPATPITIVTDDFFIVKGNPWRYQGPYTLQGKRLGVITDYGYGDIVRKYIADNKAGKDKIIYASGGEAVRNNIMNLVEGRTQVLVESRLVMDYWLQKLNLQDKVEWAGGVPQDSIYVAFAPNLPASRERAKQYDDGVRRMQQTRELAGLYRGYNISLP